MHSNVYKRNVKKGPEKDRLLNVNQARALLNCSKSQVYNLRNEGKIKGFPIGREKGIRFPESSILSYLESQSQSAD